MSNPKTMILGGAMKVAPLGADPNDESAWSEIGYTTADMLKVEPDPGEEVHGTPSMLDTIREWQQKLEVKDVNRDALGSFFGIPVIESEYVPPSVRGIMFSAAGLFGPSIVAPRAEFRPFTDLEREGEWAKRAVRHGLADVLAWLGEDVGPDPDDAYTDQGLYKVNLLGAILGGVL